MAEMQRVERTGMGDNIRQPLKRRGILAAAGAVVAGMVAKQTAQPVRAGSDTNFVATGGSGTAFNVASGGYGTGISATGTNYGVYSSVAGGFGVYAVTSGTGVSGNAGVYGGAGGSGNYGVHGVASGSSGTGVRGESTTTGGVGVNGEIPATVGIAPPVPNTAANTIAVFGNNLSSGANGVGVYGSCANGPGVYGQTAASNQYGVLGTTYAVNSTAIAGTCTGNGSSAFSGGTTNPAAYAGVFQGNVVIQGRLVVSDPSYKSGALLHPDGSHRLVYCVESPESWIEDFGKGTLVGGKATVTFDADFVAVTYMGDYHVFVTEYEDHNALFVTNQTASGFEVRAKGNATASGKFSWRAVVKPKSTVKQERLGKFTMPNLPLPDVSEMPKPMLHPASPAKP